MINLSAVLVFLAVLSHAAAQTDELDADNKRNNCVALCIESYGSNVTAQQTCHAKCLQNGEFDPNLGSDTADVVYYNKCLKNCDTDKDLSPKCPLDCKDHHEAKRLAAAPAPGLLDAIGGVGGVFAGSLSGFAANLLETGFNDQTPALNDMIHNGMRSYGQCGDGDTPQTCSCQARQTDPNASCQDSLLSMTRSWLYQLTVERITGFHTMSIGSINVQPSTTEASYMTTVPVEIDYLALSYDASTCFLFNTCYSALDSTAAPIAVNNSATLQVALTCSKSKPYIKRAEVRSVTFAKPLELRASIYTMPVKLYDATPLFTTYSQQLLQTAFDQDKLFGDQTLVEYINDQINQQLGKLPIHADFPCPNS
ncbi:hypothetical protein RI367_000798 [Sorochytrium milnesiophthora]